MLSKMMVVQPHSTIHKKKINNAKESSEPVKGEENNIKKVNDIKTDGLLIPGANWEKYKSLLDKSKASNKESTESSITKSPRKRHRAKQFNNRQGSQVIMQPKAPKQILKDEDKTVLTKQIAIDCEMVGIGDGTDSMLARVSIVNKYGNCVYDKYVKPTEKIQDYRSAVSGIYPHHLTNAEEFRIVQEEVAEILKGRLLIGHALKNDLEVLYLKHPRWQIRDTSRYKPFRKVVNGNTPSLKKLASELLGIDIQTGEHNSVEDARSTMQLYILYKKNWEMEFKSKRR